MDEHEAKVLQKAKTVANAHFVELVLRKSENDPTIRVSNVGVKFATNKGDNFASDMMRLNVEYNRNNNSDILEKRQLVVKFAPMTECAAYDRASVQIANWNQSRIWFFESLQITKSTMFDTEIKMMSDTLEKMNHLLGKDNRVNGRCLHVQRENPLFLVIEDLAPLGFRMSEQKMGLDLDHCALVMRTIAKFHASSVAVCEKVQKLTDIFRSFSCFFRFTHVKKLWQKCVRKLDKKNWQFGPIWEFFRDVVNFFEKVIQYWTKLSLSRQC